MKEPPVVIRLNKAIQAAEESKLTLQKRLISLMREEARAFEKNDQSMKETINIKIGAIIAALKDEDVTIANEKKNDLNKIKLENKLE